jgi:hypothetical protein
VIFKARRLPHNATTVAIASRFQPQDLGDLAALLKSFILDNFLPGLADEKEERNEAGNYDVD